MWKWLIIGGGKNPASTESYAGVYALVLFDAINMSAYRKKDKDRKSNCLCRSMHRLEGWFKAQDLSEREGRNTGEPRSRMVLIQTAHRETHRLLPQSRWNA